MNTTTNPTPDFDDFADIAKDFGITEAPRALTPKAVEHLADETKRFTEGCPACRGTGKFVSWSGRVVGDCFKCKGVGKRTYKSSPETRAHNRVKAATRRDGRWTDKIDTFIKAYPHIVTWINETAGTFEFAAKMRDGLAMYGSLTPNMIAACEKCIARKNEWKEKKTSDIDVTLIHTAFNKAREYAAKHGEGIEKLRLRYAGFTFSLDRSDVNVLWVKSDTEKNPHTGKRLCYGKTNGDKFESFKACTPEIRDRIVEIAKDPAAAARAYGQHYNFCSCCSRKLTNPKSREMGIGPICAERFGF
jgi:hypothetical protein